MSHDITLIYPNGDVAQVDRHQEGATINVRGSTAADLNITYNYGPLIRMAAKVVGWNLLTKGLGEEGATLAKLDLLVQVYRFAEDGLGALYSKTGKETAPILEAMADVLGSKRAEDYWAATPGNAGHALGILADWARQHPDAVWNVT